MKKVSGIAILAIFPFILSSCNTEELDESGKIPEVHQEQNITPNNQQEDTSLKKDKDHVYYHDKILEGADPASFESIPYNDSDFLFSIRINMLYIYRLGPIREMLIGRDLQ